MSLRQTIKTYPVNAALSFGSFLGLVLLIVAGLTG